MKKICWLNSRFEEILKEHSPQIITSSLEPLLTENKKEKIEKLLQGRMGSLEIAMESPVDIHNVFASVRSCEAMGASQIHIINYKGKKRKSRRTTQGAFYWTELYSYPSFQLFFQKAKKRDLFIAGACAEAKNTLDQLPIDRSLCLLFGSEHFGLSDQAKHSCDQLFSIPMHGMSQSLNLSVSVAISTFDLLQRKRRDMGRSGDLTPEEKTRMRAWYYARTIGMHRVENIVKWTNNKTQPITCLSDESHL